ncbi:MAG TPA: SNF2-related protein [Anaerolineales bacterium]
MAKITAETLSIERLKSAAGQKVFEQGQAFYQRGKVEVEEVTDLYAICTVHDYRSNEVEIRLAGNYIQFKCLCNYASRGLICDHDVAATLALQHYLRRNQPNRWKAQLSQAIQGARSAQKRSTPHAYFLFFSLQENESFNYTSWKVVPYQLALGALPKERRLEVSGMNPAALAEYIQATPELSTRLKPTYTNINPAGCLNCPPESVMLANFITDRERGFSYSYSQAPVAQFLTVLARTQSPLCKGTIGDPLKQRLVVLPQAGELQVKIARAEPGLHLSARIILGDREVSLRTGEVDVVSAAPFWVLAGDTLFELENTGHKEFLMSWIESPELVIPPNEEVEFLDKFYLPLAEQIPVEGEPVQREQVQGKPVPRLYLSDAKGGLQAVLRFGYGEVEVPYNTHHSSNSLLHKAGSWTLIEVQRDVEQEEAAYRALSSSSYGLKRAPLAAQPGAFSLRARFHPVDFLVHSVPHLAQDGFEIYGEEQLKTARINRNSPILNFNVTSGIDWFDVKVVVNFGELEVSLKDVRRLVRKQERYIKLADGSIGEIPLEWIERYKHLFALGEDTGEGLRLSQHHLTLIDELLAGADRAHTDAEFERRRERLHSFAGIHPTPLPAGFTGELRPYQKAGYDWLHFLHEFEFGGCLADDMGLGKTVQVLAFLQSLKEGCAGSPPPCQASLVVVPRSLLVNWQREAARFTPDLRLLIYFDKDRVKDTSTFDQYDVVLTTYGVMLRDIHVLQPYRFHVALLDESQVIKNPLAQTAKAARLLQARQRLVLTGTPVENSTLELWSQFAFLNPGLLGNMEYFKSEFAGPIERKGDEQAAQFLRKMVYPFILRRTKDQVAPELPPRSERILFSDMDPAQRKLYNRTRDLYRGLLMGMLANEGMNQARMKILEGLLRLRQISNHPRLMDEKFRGESGKFELLLETIETLRSEGHKALIFSQFVQMLKLVRAELDARQIPYTYLDGHTRDRQAEVDRFQADPRIPFFLISLKAGGQGLNLTAADYVIHIDPWWNPAVEMQATDRTHRIGQDKPVFVYKLIARDSVEEKILLLQDRKRSLVDQLITTEGSFFKDLTPEDVQTLFS